MAYHGRISLSLIAAFSVLSSLSACPLHAALPSLPAPNENEAQFIGVVTKLNPMDGTITAEVETVVGADGTEMFFGKPVARVFKVQETSHIHWMDTEHRWLGVAELKVGQQIAAYGVEAGRETMTRRIILPERDPMVPFMALVIPPQLNPVEHDQVCMDPVTVPMIFPVQGRSNWSDTFLASRGGGTRRHRGQDIFGPKMLPLIACFDGVVSVRRERGISGNIVTLDGDNGWTAQYYHVNNDTPGTDDGKGTDDYAFAPGIKNGARVYAGQLLGWLGDSGNAETTPPHLHFELWSQDTGAVYNAASSLRAARKIPFPLVYAPMPQLKVRKDETRMDGVVRQVDLARQVLVLDLLAQQSSGKPIESILRPTKGFLRQTEKSQFWVLGADRALSLTDLLIGDRVTAIGRKTEPGRAAELQALYAMRPGTPVAAAASDGSVIVVEATPQRVAPQDEFLLQAATGLITEINEKRSALGLPQLVADLELCKLSMDWSRKMIDQDFFDLRDPMGLSLSGLTGREEARALISSAESPAVLRRELMAAHQDMLLNPAARRIGIAHSYIDEDPGKVQKQSYWTLLLTP